MATNRAPRLPCTPPARPQSGDNHRRTLLLLFHLLTAALDATRAALGHDHLRSALGAQIHFSQLIGHLTDSVVSGFRLLVSGSLLPSKDRLPLFQEGANAYLPIARRL